MIQFWLIYLIKASLSFMVLYAFYTLFWRNKTFHTINRVLLLSILLASFIVPLIKISIPYNQAVIPSKLFEFGPFHDFSVEPKHDLIATESQSLNITKGLFFTYSIGVLLLTSLLIRQVFQIIRVKQVSSSKAIGRFLLVTTPKKYPPFSFFYWIFIPANLSGQQNEIPIIEHEKIHAKQLHTLDLLLTEIFCIFLWFVPFVYSFKRSIKNVHEYIADQELTKNNNAKISYLQLLANETEKYSLVGLSSNFYCKTLKNRITMITKNETKKIGKLAYLLILPAFALLIQSFNLNTNNALAPTNKPDSSEFIPSRVPIQGNYTLSSAYGQRMHPIKKKMMMHNGVDFKAKSGTPVMATANGTVIKSEFIKDSYGEVIVIQHNNTYTTLYAQLLERKVNIGEKVSKGQVIGLVGSSGLSTGAHVHYEIKKDGEYVNPERFFK